jgi:hypothetical protein
MRPRSEAHPLGKITALNLQRPSLSKFVAEVGLVGFMKLLLAWNEGDYTGWPITILKRFCGALSIETILCAVDFSRLIIKSGLQHWLW